MWNLDVLLDAAMESLSRREAELVAEQAVSGLDGLDEVGLHPILASGFEAAGFGVYRERVYPGEVESRKKHAARERCDLVLTEDAESRLLDPVQELLALDASEGTLFAPVAESMVPDEGIVEVGEAYWLELKAVGQFGLGQGVPGPNRQYASLLTSGPSKDVIKIARDPMINAGGIMVLLFAADEDTARHDLGQMTLAMLGDDLPIGSPRIETVPIQDRSDHAVVGVGLVPVRL